MVGSSEVPTRLQRIHQSTGRSRLRCPPVLWTCQGTDSQAGETVPRPPGGNQSRSATTHTKSTAAHPNPKDMEWLDENQTPRDVGCRSETDVRVVPIALPLIVQAAPQMKNAARPRGALCTLPQGRVWYVIWREGGCERERKVHPGPREYALFSLRHT